MRNKLWITGLILCLAMTLTSCANSAQAGNGSNNPADLIPDVMMAENGIYDIGFCHADSGLKDGGFSEGTYNGIKLFATENGYSYKYYGNHGANSTDEDYYDALKAAIQGGATAVVMVGYQYAAPLAKIAKEYPDMKFIFIDGSVPEGCTNVAAITFRDQECGFLAGYSAVKEGFTKIGFSGGGGGTNDSVNRYGYGYVQGAEAAAKELGIKVDMNYSFQYGSTFSPSPELQAMCNAWYESGTEVIFSAGGSMFNSVAAAAANNDAWVIAPDSDMSYKSKTVLTSALKRVDIAAYLALEALYGDEWDKYCGKMTVLSAKEGTVGLPVDSWRFSRFTPEEYEKILNDIVEDRIVVDGDFTKLGSTEHVNVKNM